MLCRYHRHAMFSLEASFMNVTAPGKDGIRNEVLMKGSGQFSRNRNGPSEASIQGQRALL